MNIDTIFGYFVPLSLGLAGYLFGRRKDKAVAQTSELDNIDKAATIWRTLAQDLEARLKLDIDHLRQENFELKEQVGKLSTANSELSEQVSKLSDENATLKKKMKSLDQENCKLIEQLKIFNQRNAQE